MSDSRDSNTPRRSPDHPTIWSTRTAMDPVEQIAAELRERWARGDRARIEQCGPLFEKVGADAERLLDLIYHEILVREEHGERPEAVDYATRFPELVDRIARLLGVHRVVGGDQEPAEDAGFGPAPPDYEILQEVGRGGMAVVYRARQRSLHRIVALKMVATSRNLSAEMLTRFRQEALAVAQLQHANVVQIFEVGQVAGRPYLALEFVAGGTLQGRLDGRPLAPESAARLIETLARAIHYAHRRGIVHRDLKPANILLEAMVDVSLGAIESGGEAGLWLDAEATGVEVFRPKISDFGLAKAAHFDSDLTVTGQILGTPSYMSPEQAGAKSYAVAPSTDIYSLGAILYQLLTGRPPFHGTSMLDVLDQVRRDDPPPPRQLQTKVPRDLETICLHCLEKSPDRRYTTAEQLADDLRRFLDHVPIAARRSSWMERLGKWVYRRPVVAALSSAVVLSLVGGLVGISWQSLKAHAYAERVREERDHARRLHRAAIAERDAADKLRERAEILQAESRKNFERAFKVVDEIRKKGTRYYQRPEHVEVGGELLEFTLKYYEGFLHDESHDPAVRHAAATAFVNAGDIVGGMGNRERAATFFERAIPLREGLVNEQPENWSFRRDLASVWRRIANTRRHLDERVASATAYRAAIADFERALQLNPTHEGTRVLLANTLVNEAALFIQQRRAADAATCLGRAESLLRESIRQSDTHSSRAELALCLDDLSQITWAMGNAPLAQLQIEEAFQLRTKLLAKGWNPTDSMKLLARSHVSRVRLHQGQRQWEQARAEARHAIDLLAPLAAQNPLRMDLQQEFPQPLTCQAILLHEAGDFEAAEKLFQEAVAVCSRLVDRFPNDPVIARAYARQQYLFGEFQRERGLSGEAHVWIERALATFGKATEQWPNSARAMNDLAWVLANGPIDELVDARRAHSLARRAMELDPDDISPWSTLGVACYRLGDWPGATAALEKATQKGNLERRTDSLFLALALLKQGNQAVARIWMERHDQSAAPEVFQLLEDRRLAAEAAPARIGPGKERQTPEETTSPGGPMR